MSEPTRRTAALGLLALAAGEGASARAPVLVFAAASLTGVLPSVKSAAPMRFSFASSAIIARQIAQGAPADIVATADSAWMDDLDKRGLLRAGTRRDFLSNALVLIAPARAKAAPITLENGVDLQSALGARGLLAVADPASVPAGRYAKAALTALGAWAQLEARLAPAQDVRAALSFVARGEAPLGVVYRTDALAEPRVKVLGVFPTASHPPIVYPIAILGAAKNPLVDQAFAALTGAGARAIYMRAGFGALC